MRATWLLLLVGCGGPDEVVPIDAAPPVDAPPVDAGPDAAPPPDGFVPLDAPDDSFQPDLIFVEHAMANPPVLQTMSFDAQDAAVIEGCVGAPGTRTLLRFDTVTGNIGNLDLWMGVPSADNPLFEYSPAHGHYHVPGFAEYRLRNAGGQVVAGHKQAFCLMDSIEVEQGSGIAGKYHCGNQGITAGWADVYARYLDCQWIDVTGVPNGTYTLEMVVNPDGTLPDSDLTNNVYSVVVQI